MLNKAILMGRLTRDPEIRTTSTGKSVCSFSIAVDNGYGDNRQTDFINCVAWNNQAEFIGKYFTKGMLMIIIGRISTRTWDGQDGRKNYVTEVVVSEVSFGETKKSREAGGNAPAASPQNTQNSFAEKNDFQAPGNMDNDEFVPLSEIDDDLPF